MQTLHASALSGLVPIRYPIIQNVARNLWIDVNNESAVTLTVSLGGRIYLIPPNTTARYAMDNTETFVQFTPNSTADPARDSVSGTVYNEQDSIPADIERGANAADILPITTADIIDGAITAAKVATNAINTANIVAGAVNTAQLANGAVTNPILATLAVGTGNVQSAAITNALLASLAVANANIQASAVQTAQIADGNVTTIKIANLAVTSALIANAAVGTAQIANAAITTALIQTAAITDALIASVSAGKITAGTISATISITSPSITGGSYQTASSGKRINIDASADVARIRYFTGGATETSPGYLALIGAAPNTSVVLGAPLFSGGIAASFQVNSDGTASFIGTKLNNPSGAMIIESNTMTRMAQSSTQDVAEEVGNGAAVVRTVNYAASGYREHDASVHTNISDIRFKDVKETSHNPGHHRSIVRQVGKPFTFNWKPGHGDNGKYTRWGLDARQLPAEFTKQTELDGELVFLVDPQSMIAVLFGAVNDLIDEIELLKGSK